MLKKLLPSIFEKKTDQSPSPQKQVPQNQGRPSNSEGSLESGFNLVSTPQKVYIVPKYATKLMLIIRNFIVLMSIIFGVTLILNYGATSIVEFQKNLQKQFLLEIDEYYGVEEKAKLISAKTLAYKRFSNERKPILSKSKFVLDNVGSKISLKNVDIRDFGFTINFTGEKPTDFTELILRYLDEDMLSQIVISSASYRKSENTYSVILEGTFK